MMSYRWPEDSRVVRERADIPVDSCITLGAQLCGCDHHDLVALLLRDSWCLVAWAIECPIQDNIRQIGIVVRVSGRWADFGESRTERFRIARSRGYASCEIIVGRSSEALSVPELHQHIADLVEEAYAGLILRLQKRKYIGEHSRLIEQIAVALGKFRMLKYD